MQLARRASHHSSCKTWSCAVTPEFARELDDKIAFVLGMRFSEAIHANDWSAAIRAIELLDPVIARLGSGTRENEFRRYLVRLAQALPAEHLREKEFVQRASFLIHRRTEEEDDEAIPTGTMVPGPLPGGGTLVNEDGAASDFKTVLACLPDFSNAIKDVNRIVMVSEVPYFAGWHLVEVMPRLRQANDLP